MTTYDLLLIEEAARKGAMLAGMGAASVHFIGLEDGNVARIRINVMSEDDAAEADKGRGQK